MHHDEKNKIGLTVALSIVVGTIIGSGVFMKPGSVLDYSGSSNMAILAWVIGGLLTLASGLTVAEIGAQIPKNGGLYTYLEENLRKFLGIFIRLDANDCLWASYYWNIRVILLVL